LPLRERDRTEGRVVVWTNGCFDVLHAGHIASLRAAAALGDVLVVGINEDETVRKAKGEGRPVHALAQRAALLSALEMVDWVVAFAEPTPLEILSRLQPDVHCKGADYAPPHGAPMPEADTVRAYGGRIEFLPLVAGLSTTSILQRTAP
jgi:rfaE bifunctional protein nucleotidyltransferase chain/domain